jgi:hypothetical protein
MWLLRYFLPVYEVFCQPTAFAARARDMRFLRRLGFMAVMAPAVVAAQAVVAGDVIQVGQAARFYPEWWPTQPQWWASGLGWSLTSLATAIGVGAIWSAAAGVAWGVTWGSARWLVGAVLPWVVTLPPKVAAGLDPWAALGFAFGVTLGVTVATRRSAWVGVVLGLILAPWRIYGAAAFIVCFLLGHFRVEWYGIDTIATLMVLGVARVTPRRAKGLLHRSPIYWREPIWLPLVGLKRFLRLVGEHDFRAGVDECLFVISQRPTQAKAARAALLEIVARHLADLKTVQQIASAADELAHATPEGVPLPGVLQDALPGLQQLARHAEQHLTALLPHNRRRALDRLHQGAEELARRLAMAQGSLAGMLVDVARKWREVAAARLEEVARTEEAAGYVHNPFVFGQPIEETETNLFVGRRDTVKEIEISLLGGEQKPALVLWGPRRMGKTSVLLQLPRLLGPEFVPVFVDMQAMRVRENIAAFFHSVTEAAAQALRRRGVEARGLRASDLETNPFSAFATWMEEVERGLGGERYLLLCLDEFERLEASIREGRLPKELMDDIRHIMQHHPHIVVVLAGSHRPDEMELNWPDALISTKMIRVSYLTEEEARQLITRPVPDFQISYAPGSVARIIEVTRCQPYLVQAVCYELVNHLNLEERREATAADVEVAVEHALDSAHLYFAEMWRQLSGRQRTVLHEVAAAPEGLPLGQLASVAQATTEEVEADLKRLATRGLVELLAQSWHCQVPLVAEWIKRQPG